MKILFISHDASLTGAPLLLLNLISCLRKYGYICNRVIIKNNSGVLAEEFRKGAEVVFFNEGLNNSSKGLINRVAKKITHSRPSNNDNVIQQWITEADIVFSNTITNGDFLNRFKFKKNQLIVSYIHELQMASKVFTNKRDLRVVLEKTKLFLVPSEAVKNFLIKDLNISPDSIKKLNYFIPSANETSKKEIIRLKQRFIVGMIGTLDWRKGAEILSVIVVNFFNQYPDADVAFLWKGANKASIEYKRIHYELGKTGLAEKVIFEEPTLSVADFYSKIDILLLCSKEDPYPLVVLEAASFKRPTICFDRSGGAAEFVQNDAGTTVSYLDITGVTSSIFEYYNDSRMLNQKGMVAYERYRDLHYNEFLIQEQFNQIF